MDTDPATAGDQNTLTFKASDYGAKRVRVRFDENEDSADAGGELIHTVTGGDYGAAGVTAGEVTVVERDKDRTNIAVSPSSLTVREGGGAGRYTLRLTAKPFDTVVLSVRSSNPEVTVDTDDTAPGDQSEVTFTPADWSLPQAVAVRAGSDDDDADDTASLSYSTVLGRNLDGGVQRRIAARPVSVRGGDGDGRRYAGPVAEHGVAVADGGAHGRRDRPGTGWRWRRSRGRR